MKALLLGKAHPDEYSWKSNLLSKSHHSCSLHHCIPPGITMICVYVTRLCKVLPNGNHALHFLTHKSSPLVFHSALNLVGAQFLFRSIRNAREENRHL